MSNRNRNEAGNRNNNIGFRCAGDGERVRYGLEPEPGGVSIARVRYLHFRVAVPTSRGRQIVGRLGLSGSVCEGQPERIGWEVNDFEGIMGRWRGLIDSGLW